MSNSIPSNNPSNLPSSTPQIPDFNTTSFLKNYKLAKTDAQKYECIDYLCYLIGNVNLHHILIKDASVNPSFKREQWMHIKKEISKYNSKIADKLQKTIEKILVAGEKLYTEEEAQSLASLKKDIKRSSLKENPLGMGVHWSPNVKEGRGEAIPKPCNFYLGMLSLDENLEALKEIVKNDLEHIIDQMADAFTATINLPKIIFQSPCRFLANFETPYRKVLMDQLESRKISKGDLHKAYSEWFNEINKAYSECFEKIDKTKNKEKLEDEFVQESYIKTRENLLKAKEQDELALADLYNQQEEILQNIKKYEDNSKYIQILENLVDNPSKEG